jgi:type II secretory pathway predicted ATPase ExeA
MMPQIQGGACLPAIRHCGAQGLCRHDGRSGHRKNDVAQDRPQFTFAKRRISTAFVFNPRLDVLDFLEFVLTDFGIPPKTRTKSGMLMQLNRWLIERFRAGELCAIVVDEAQNLSWELLEEIRLLTNLETSSEKLVQIVLSGQPELEEKLRDPQRSPASPARFAVVQNAAADQRGDARLTSPKDCASPERASRC